MTSQRNATQLNSATGQAANVKSDIGDWDWDWDCFFVTSSTYTKEVLYSTAGNPITRGRDRCRDA
jgi:hypothetical protein